ncbi:MAG: hypothetical protein HY079_08145 [Elusimicrobia bacterium]|nr:hypothetical protein [Elusimicrobiota bacterium]
MRTPIIAALLLAAAAVSAHAVTDASFDAGVDVSALAARAKDAAKKDDAAVKASYIGGSRYDTDCVRFTFSATDAPVTDRVWLRSQEWVTECQPVGDPRRGGGQQCWDRPGFSYSEAVRITLRDRQPLLPWEHDSFRVCLQGPWVYTDALETAYDYTLVSNGADGGDIVLAAGRKIPQSPDPGGISGTLTAQLKMTFADKWASYYAGEKVVLKIELKKVVKFWPDATVLTKDVELPAAAAYAADLNAFVAEMASKPEAGKQYYAKYSFKRVGSVSRDSWTKAQETGRVSYAPAALAFAR